MRPLTQNVTTSLTCAEMNAAGSAQAASGWPSPPFAVATPQIFTSPPGYGNLLALTYPVAPLTGGATGE